ncbi:MAG: hypothetical protein ACRDBQ_18990 [Shewanella sp.]
MINEINIILTMKPVSENVSIAEQAICQKKLDLMGKMVMTEYGPQWAENYGRLRGLVGIMDIDHKVVTDSRVMLGIDFALGTCAMSYNALSRVKEYPREFEMGKVDGVNHGLAMVLTCGGDWDTAAARAVKFLCDVVEDHYCTTAVMMAQKTIKEINCGKEAFLMNVTFL